MDNKKLNPTVIVASALTLAAIVMVIAAVATGVRRASPREEPVVTPSVTSKITEPAVTTVLTTTSVPETTLPESETTTVPTTVTTVTTTTEATTTTVTTTTVATTTTVTTTTAATTTTVATTTVPPPPDFGILGYNFDNPASSDKAAAKGNVDSIIINEVCAKSKSSLKDKDGEYPDWIELYNPTDSMINLEGVGLSDDVDTPLKWVFPNVNIQPKSYLVVFCSDKNKSSPELHTNFKISSGNEQILLSKPDGSVIDSVIISSSDNDITFGRYPNASSTYRLLEATPGQSNDKSTINLEAGLAAPILSKASGFYSSQFNLSITAAPDTTIYYTTDGSVPTTSSKKYSSEITIRDRSSERAVLTYKKGTTVDSGSENFPSQEFEKSTVIRAIAVDSKGRVSKVSTATYFVGSQILNKYKNVAVISVVSDPDGLYNKSTGIYVAGDVFTEWRKKNSTAALDGSTPANFNQRGRDWERDAHVDFFRSGDLEFSEDVGMRIHGGWSRNSQQKSLKFYMRSDYGESKLKYKLFQSNRSYADGKVIGEYKRFMIRNGGNDSFIMLFKDAWTQACVKYFNFATQASDVVVCFLDGEYWGVYTLNEVYDDNYVEENYGVDADNVILIKAGELEEGLESDYDNYWRKAVDFVEKNDMSVEANYQKACEYFDIESFAEYIAMEVYIGNEDWLWNNWACWRARETSSKLYHDGKWRFMVYDTEYSMNLYGSGGDYRYNILKDLANGDGHLGKMVKSLLKSQSFKSTLVIAFEDVMNIAFNPTSAAKLLDQYYNKYSPYLSQHFRRFVFWQNTDGVKNNVESWKKWLKKRYDYMPEQLNSVLKLGTTKMNILSMTVNDTSGGYVRINGIPITFTGGKWEGKYFGGYKLKIEAVPANGYEFTGWSGSYSGDSAAITFDPTGAYSLTANFKKKG